jgi:Domain of unknown function (DUF5134)
VSGPAWLAAGFAALTLLIAGASACRLTVGRLRGRATEPDVDAHHVLMGVAMAGMFESRLSLAPAAAWQVVFAASAAWFAWRAIRGRVRRGGPGGPWCAHPAPHAVECAAMIYMLMPASRSPGTAMPGMGEPASAGNPAVALVLALFMLGYLLWTTDRLASMSRATPAADVAAGNRPPLATPAPATSGGGVGTLTVTASAPAGLTARAGLAPRLAACCTIGMSIAMGYMLVTMI